MEPQVDIADDVSLPTTASKTALAALTPLPETPWPAAPRKGRALAALVVLYMACCFLMVPIATSINGAPTAWFAALLFGIVGCILAQGNLLAAWLAWSVVSFPRRLIVHWMIATGLFTCWLAGLRIAEDNEFLEIGGTVAAVVPLISLGAQLPLWVARQWFGWRLVKGGQSPVAAEPPLTIRDLFGATLLVALTCAVARQAPVLSQEREFAFAMALFTAAAATISMIAMLPAGALLLRMRDFQRSLVFSGLYAGLFVFILWLAGFLMYWHGFPVPPHQIFVGLTSLMLSFAATLVVTASAARSHGYRLVWGRRHRPELT